MATMIERLQQLHAANPDNKPIHPNRLGEIWFSDMPGFNAKPANHNGGLRKGPTVALGLVARMSKKGLMIRWVDPEGQDLRSMWLISKAGLAAMGTNGEVVGTEQ